MATFDINDVARRVQYTSTGQTGPFNFNFQVNASSELLVYIDDTEKTETTHYTVSLNADGTGSVTFTSATTTGELITIIGDQALSRTTVFQVGQVNNPTTLETEFDNTLIRQQQIKEITDRALQLKPTTPRTVTGSGTSGPLYWPYDATASNNASRVIAYDSAGTSLELGPTTTDISTIAGIASDVTTVSGIAADVTSVAADATDIGTVATNIASVNTVATNINDVIAVANDLNEAVSEVETVANDLNEAVSEIDTVASSITNVDTVGNNISNVNTVAGISSNVTTVAGISSNVTTVAGISSDVTAVAGDATDIGTVATDLAGTDTIGTVAGGIANVNTVATNIANVNTVAGNNSNITTVAGISGNVTTVAGISANVTTVANDSTDIGTVATNIANVNTVAGISANVTTVAGISSDVTAVAADATDIGTVATNIANVNNVGGSIANVNTVASNISGVNSFAERYRVDSADPTTSLDQGDLAYNTTANALKYYDGSAWQQIVAGGLTDIVQDGSPQLGGNLDTNGNAIIGTSVNINASNGDLMITATENGPVSLRYDNNLKLSTKSDGVNITGELEADSLDIDGDGDITGNLTLGGNLNLGDNDKAQFGASQDLQIYHNGTLSRISDTGTGNLEIQATNLRLQNALGAQDYATFTSGGTAKLFHNGSSKLATTSSGIDVTGTVTADGGAFTGDVTFTDNSDIKIGSSDDMFLVHNGSNSYIVNQTGTLFIRGDDIQIESVAGENHIIGTANGSVDLYYDNSKKFETTSTGIDVTGTVTADGISLGDNEKAQFGASNDLQIYHDGSNSYISDVGTGNIILQGTHLRIRDHLGDNYITAQEGGAVTIYHDSNTKFATTSTGVDVTGVAVTDGVTSSGNVLVGKTSTDLGTAGQALLSNGVSFFTRDGDKVLRVNRLTSDGDIIDLLKDGTTVGSIAVKNSNNLQIRSTSSNHSGIEFATNTILPADASGALTNNQIDFGSSSNSFKDLYLGGGAVISEATLTDGATISWDVSTKSVAKVTLGGNRTLSAPSNALDEGQFISLLVIQDGTGSRTLTWNAVYEFASDTAPTLTTTGGKGDLFVFRYNGTKWLEVGRNLNLSLS